jgi:hypothetical protein
MLNEKEHFCKTKFRWNCRRFGRSGNVTDKLRRKESCGFGFGR